MRRRSPSRPVSRPRDTRSSTSETSHRTGSPMMLMAAILAFSALFASLLVVRLHRDVAPIAAPGAGTRAIVFLVDGAGAADTERVPMPNVQALAGAGVSFTRAWVGQAVATAPASAATIGSGAFPNRHGVIGDVWRDPNTGAEMQASDEAGVHRGALEQLMRANGVSSLAGMVRSADNQATTMATGGRDCAVVDAAATWAASYVLCGVRDVHRWVPAAVAGHSLPAGSLDLTKWSVPVVQGRQLAPSVEGWRLGQEDDWVTSYTIAARRAVHPTLLVVDFPEIAAVAPFAPASDRAQIVRTLLQGIDRDIGRIVDATRRDHTFRQTVFAVTSGEAVTPFDQVVPRSTLKEGVTAGGGQTVYLQARSSAFIGLQDPLQAQPTAQAFQSERLRSVDAIYYRTQRNGTYSYGLQYLNPLLPPGLGDAAGYLVSTMESQSAPDVVLDYGPRTGTDGARMGGFGTNADAGGLQWDSQHIPLILSGPGVKSGASVEDPARLVDIAPTLAQLLGHGLGHSDGIVLATALTTPPPNSMQAERDVMDRLVPLVQALQQRAQELPQGY